MQIAGFDKLSLLNYPDKVAATIFTNGCNFACPYCQNSELVLNAPFNELISEDEVLSYLDERKKLLDLAYKNKAKRNNITEKIFSLKNLYKNWTKYKLITILGCEFYLKSKTYVKNNPV